MPKRNDSSNNGKSVQQLINQFWEHAAKAEKLIRENYGKGRIPPDCCGDGWDVKFDLIYKTLEPHLPKSAVQYYQSPPGTAYQSYPFTATNPVEALMFLLNPADEAFGEPGYLETAEFQQIKKAATKFLMHVENPPPDHTETEKDLLNAVTDTPQTVKEIARKADCEYQAARKYLPRLFDGGYVLRTPKRRYYKVQ